MLVNEVSAKPDGAELIQIVQILMAISNFHRWLQFSRAHKSLEVFVLYCCGR